MLIRSQNVYEHTSRININEFSLVDGANDEMNIATNAH